MKITEELMAKLIKCKSVDEVMDLAKAEEIEATKEEAETYFETYCNKASGELEDDELDNVAGGGCYKGNRLIVTSMHVCDNWVCVCGSTSSYVNTSTTSGSGLYCSRCKYKVCCKFCKYKVKDKGMNVCSHPANFK